MNTAFETLKSPLKRAIYMIELDGEGIEENPQLPPDFLMEQIERREQLEAIEDGDFEALDAFKREVTGVMKGLEEEFAGATALDSEKDRDKAKTVVYEMQFMNRLLQAAVRLEEKMLDY